MFYTREPLEVIVNGNLVQPGYRVKDVKSFEIRYMPGLLVPKNQGKNIAKWVYELVQKCESEYITYNGVLILKTEVKPFKG